jgi:hypothetical protein
LINNFGEAASAIHQKERKTINDNNSSNNNNDDDERCKAPGKSSDSDRDSDSKGNETLLASVLPLLVNSNVLFGEDLEAMVLTCKDLQAVAMQDSLWKTLCNAIYPEAVDFLPATVVEKAYFRNLYHGWKGPLPCSVAPPLAAPSCTFDDIELTAYVTYRGKLIAKFPLTSHRWYSDQFVHDFNHPVVVECRDAPGRRFIGEDFHVKVLLRKTDESMCCILDVPGCDIPAGPEYSPFKMAFCIPNNMLPFRSSTLAAKLLSRCRYRLAFAFELSFRSRKWACPQFTMPASRLSEL